MKELFLIMALSAPALSFNQPQPTFNHADRSFFAMLRAVTPDHAENWIAIVGRHASRQDLTHSILWLSPGGWLLLEMPLPMAKMIMDGREFELLPMTYRGMVVYRKMDRRMGASA